MANNVPNNINKSDNKRGYFPVWNITSIILRLIRKSKPSSVRVNPTTFEDVPVSLV